MAKNRKEFRTACQTARRQSNCLHSIALYGSHLWYRDLKGKFSLLGYLYLLFTTFPRLFGVDYGENVGIVGLNYIGMGVGSLFGFGFSLLANKVYDRLTEANGGKGLPEYRLPTLFITSWFIPIGLFWYGWSAQAKVHWIMPVLGTVWFGLGVVSIFVAIQNYLVDGFRYAASALAASTVLRSLFG